MITHQMAFDVQAYYRANFQQ